MTQGRPLKDKSRGNKRPVTFMLYADDIALIESVDGNRSAAIEQILYFYKNNQSV